MFITRIPLIGRFNEGISVIGINTQKGKVLTEAISDKFEFSDLLSESETIESNDNFICPIIRPVERSSFYNSVMTKGYKGILKKTYFSKSYKKRLWHQYTEHLSRKRSECGFICENYDSYVNIHKGEF